MNLPFLQKNQDQYYYPEEGGDKKKTIILFGGVFIILLLGALLLFGGGEDNSGKISMQNSVEATGDALGIIDTYQETLQYAPTKNDVALVQIILRGNYQKLNNLLVETYDEKALTESPEPDEDSKESLDRAVRNNTIDNDIIEILSPKIETALQSLTEASADFTSSDTLDILKTSAEDFQSIQNVLAKPR